MPRVLAALVFTLALLLAGCSGGSNGREDSFTPVPQPEPIDEFVVGRPLARNGIGDVERVFARYDTTRASLIAFYQEQPWFKDGLTRDEALFVERGISFVAKYDGPRRARISEQTIREKLYRYEKLDMSQGEVEVLLIFEPGQDADREMALVRLILPALESVVGVPYPEKVMTLVNGDFDINDFNEGEFIRIDRCCVVSSFILAHELAHTYWSMASSWFNEGMADLTAVMVIEALNEQAASGWRQESLSLESYYASRKRLAARHEFKLLPQRLAVEGLYETADVFLYDIRQVLGAEAFRDAVRRIYLTSDYGRTHLGEFRLQEVLMQFADAAGDEQIMAMFNEQIWGDDGQRYADLKEQAGTP